MIPPPLAPPTRPPFIPILSLGAPPRRAEMAVHQTRAAFKAKYGRLVDEPRIGADLAEGYWVRAGWPEAGQSCCQ